MILPFVSRYAAEPAIVAWDLFNEPEWAVLGSRRTLSARVPVLLPSARFLEEAVARLREASSSQPLTVGLASARGLALVRGLGLGFHQVHWYDSVESRYPLGRPVTDLGLDLPIVLGEFPTRGSSRSVEEILDRRRRWRVMRRRGPGRGGPPTSSTGRGADGRAWAGHGTWGADRGRGGSWRSVGRRAVWRESVSVSRQRSTSSWVLRLAKIRAGSPRSAISVGADVPHGDVAPEGAHPAFASGETPATGSRQAAE